MASNSLWRRLTKKAFWDRHARDSQTRGHSYPPDLLPPRGLMGYFIQKFSPEPQGTVLLAEQNVKSALRLSDRGFIIDEGGIRYQGTIGEIRENEEVRKKYLLV